MIEYAHIHIQDSRGEIQLDIKKWWNLTPPLSNDHSTTSTKFRLDNTKGAVIPFVENIYGVRIRVEENEEILMSQ